VLDHDFIKRFVEEQNFIASGMEPLDEHAVLKILNGFPGLSEVEYLQKRDDQWQVDLYRAKESSLASGPVSCSQHTDQRA
jgi:hypothetical protein